MIVYQLFCAFSEEPNPKAGSLPVGAFLGLRLYQPRSAQRLTRTRTSDVNPDRDLDTDKDIDTEIDRSATALEEPPYNQPRPPTIKLNLKAIERQ